MPVSNRTWRNFDVEVSGHPTSGLAEGLPNSIQGQLQAAVLMVYDSSTSVRVASPLVFLVVPLCHQIYAYSDEWRRESLEIASPPTGCTSHSLIFACTYCPSNMLILQLTFHGRVDDFVAVHMAVEI